MKPILLFAAAIGVGGGVAALILAGSFWEGLGEAQKQRKRLSGLESFPMFLSACTSMGGCLAIDF